MKDKQAVGDLKGTVRMESEGSGIAMVTSPARKERIQTNTEGAIMNSHERHRRMLGAGATYIHQLMQPSVQIVALSSLRKF